MLDDGDRGAVGGREGLGVRDVSVLETLCAVVLTFSFALAFARAVVLTLAFAFSRASAAFAVGGRWFGCGWVGFPGADARFLTKRVDVWFDCRFHVMLLL